MLSFFSALSYLNEVGDSQGRHYLILAELTQLDDASKNFKQRGEYYLANAPRDYESYFRDVAVFHREMQDDIQAFEFKLQRVLNEQANQGGFIFQSIQGLFSNKRELLLKQEVSRSSEHWRLFKQKLAEALGTNKAEPRLEWGAQYIVDNADALSGQLVGMINAYRSLLAERAVQNENLAKWAIIITALSLLFGMAFMQWIVWRIGRTAAACERVANGDFGYQLEEGARDELGSMTRAFNSLSSRVSLVLGLLTKLNTARQPGEALSAFWKDSANYLNADWMGLMIQSSDGSHLVLTHQQGVATTQKWQHRRIEVMSESKLEVQVASTLNSGDVYQCDNLVAEAKGSSGSLFFRELLQNTMLRSFMVVPLVNHDKSWRAVLIVGKGAHKQFSLDQYDLLNNLAPVIGSIFANATNNRKVAIKKPERQISKQTEPA